MFKTKIEGFNLRFSEEKDVQLIFELIKELAVYEKMVDELITTEDLLRDSIFERKVVEVIIAEYKGNPVGYVMYFYNFSSFIGQPGIYLEDIYVRPLYRGKGFGKIMLAFLAKLAEERKCWGLEWTCLHWNIPSINFYERLGATHREGWMIYRLKGQALSDLAGSIEGG